MSRCLSIFMLLLAIGGCETSFEPYAETDMHYSVFGILDAAATRQILRVEPLQDQRIYGTDSTIHATVMLRRLDTDREFIFEEQEHTFFDSVMVHNFIARMQPKPAESYRLIVRRDEDVTTTDTITFPETIPRVQATADQPNDLIRVQVRNAPDSLVVLNAIYYGSITYLTPRNPIGPFRDTLTVYHATDFQQASYGYLAEFDWTEDLDKAITRNARIMLDRIDVVGVVADEAWPNYGERTYEELFKLGQAPSNLRHGVGFVAGVASDTARITFANPEVVQVGG